MIEQGIDKSFEHALSSDLRTRLNLIIQEIPYFWEQGPYAHFTLQGPSHSERVHHQKLAQLAQELPEHARLTPDEIFIVSAAAWLYEIGMQCTTLRPTLDFDWRPDVPLTPGQLLDIRKHKHLLTHRMIIDSVRRDYHGPPLRLGLMHPDDYTQLIAEVCRWCSHEPLEHVPETLPANGVMVRVRLLVALLRLADQLYIDSSRVNLDRLEVAPLPTAQKLHWWIYHYAQTLPIDKGLIKFHYFLPQLQRDLLGHIRAVIEPNFDHDVNPVMRYLLREHRLKLLTDEPSIRYDQPAGFQREMSMDMVMYLRRQVQPIEPGNRGTLQQDTRMGDRALLVVDFENLLLQMGLEGHFLSKEDINRMLIALLTEVRQHAGRIECLAAGHWTRPDLRPTASILEELTYTLVPVDIQSQSTDALKQELQNRSHNGKLAGHIFVVAPQKALAQTIRQLDGQGQEVRAWITDNLDTLIFQALVSCKFLPRLLKLSDTPRLNQQELERTRNACILRLANAAPNGLSFAEAARLLKQITQAQEKADWWRLWLLHKNIFSIEMADGSYTLMVNNGHPEVADILQKQQTCVKVLSRLSIDSQGVTQEQLIQALMRHPSFRENDEAIVPFLTLLQAEDIVSVNAYSSPDADTTFWQLNTRNDTVIKLTAESSLPFLILGLDHTLAQSGQPVVHEHTLKKRLQNYIEPDAMDTLYRLAQAQGWVRVQEIYNANMNRNTVGVEPDVGKEEVRQILLNQEILLNILYKGLDYSMRRDELKTALDGIRSFTLEDHEIDQWLAAFQREELTGLEKDDHDTARDSIRLRLDTPLVQMLLGRMHIYNVILTLRRFLHATSPETGQTAEKIIESLLRRIRCKNNRQVAQWTLDYAKNIRLIGTSPSREETQCELLYLRKHSLVHRLDERESAMCHALTEHVGKLSRPHLHDGWVPEHVLMQELGKDKRFSYARNEHEYWLNQAIHRHKLLITKGYPPNLLLQVALEKAR